MIPIVLIHSGNPPYLKFSIRKALQKNKVYLIGDTNPQIDHKNFTFLDMKDYINDDYLKFQKIYKHLSTNNYGFEIFCFLCLLQTYIYSLFIFSISMDLTHPKIGFPSLTISNEHKIYSFDME